MTELHACFIAILFFFSTLALRAGEDSLWQLHTTDIHATYATDSMSNGVIGILPLKEPFAIEHIMMNHVFDVPRLHTVSRVMYAVHEGTGDLLQTVLNGFGGLQLTKGRVIQVSSILPPHWKKLTIIGVGLDKKTFVREL